MRHRIPWVALVLLLLPILGGCTAEPATPEAAAAAASTFMQARTGGDAARVGAMLSANAGKAITRTQLTQYLQQVHASYGGLGSPAEVEPGVVRIPVQNLTLTERGVVARWPESWLTLRREGDHWRVAWAEPLFGLAAQAYHNGLFLDALNLGDSIVTIDPYHYRGYLEMHFAYLGLKRHRQAEVAVKQALDHATPSQKPDVHDAMARFKLAVGAPADALAHARQALDAAAPFTPDLYSLRWQADTLVVAARAALAVGDLRTAESLAGQAGSIDPNNATLVVFRHQLAAKPSAPTAGR